LESVRTTESIIFSRLTKAAKSSGVVLTYTHKLFFLRLLDLAESMRHDADHELCVTLSVQELSKTLEIPLRTTIQCLNRLTACDALKRTGGEKTFPRSPTTTTINKKFYEKE